jgi:hypothetical protein
MACAALASVGKYGALTTKLDDAEGVWRPRHSDEARRNQRCMQPCSGHRQYRRARRASGGDFDRQAVCHMQHICRYYGDFAAYQRNPTPPQRSEMPGFVMPDPMLERLHPPGLLSQRVRNAGLG